MATYFEAEKDNNITNKIHSRLIRIWLRNDVPHYSELKDIEKEPGVSGVFPSIVNYGELINNDHKVKNIIFSIGKRDLITLLKELNLNYIGSEPSKDSLVLGYRIANKLGILGNSLSNYIKFNGQNRKVAGIISPTYSIFDDLIFYITGARDNNDKTYNFLFVTLYNKNDEDAVVEMLESRLQILNMVTPSSIERIGESMLEKQMMASLFISSVSWVFIIIILVSFIYKELYTRRKEFVVLNVLGATFNKLLIYLTLYVISFSTIGYIIAYLITFLLIEPTYKKILYGYTQVPIDPEILLKTFGSTFSLLLIFVLISVITIYRALNTIKIMDVLRAEI